MKVWTTQHNGLTYKFDLFESTGEIAVSKNNKPTYTISWIKTSCEWVCNCPGAVYRDHCWHRTQIPMILLQPSSTDPWAEWAEEASQMRCEGR